MADEVSEDRLSGWGEREMVQPRKVSSLVIVEAKYFLDFTFYGFRADDAVSYGGKLNLR